MKLAAKLPFYWKAVIASVPVIVFVGDEVVQAITDQSQDGTLTVSDVIRIAIVGATAYGVYKKANRPLPKGTGDGQATA